MKYANWSKDGGTDARLVRKLMSCLSSYVRNQQFNLFIKDINPHPSDKIIDVGSSPDETMKDTNLFLQKYPYPQQLTIASIENCQSLVSKYSLNKFVHIKPHGQLPFKDNYFDIVVSWATLEHVGTEEDQKYFLSEIHRIGKKVFLTTPDRQSLYEPHTNFLFLHWLPLSTFRKIAKFFGHHFWSQEKNLNPLNYKQLKIIVPSNLKILQYKLFNIFPSHLIVIRQ